MWSTAVLGTGLGATAAISTRNSVLPSGDETERAFLEATLARHDDNRSAAARELGIARSTLLYKLKKHGIT